MDEISLSVQKRSEVLGKDLVDQAVKLAGERDSFLSSQCNETFSYGGVTILTDA